MSRAIEMIQAFSGLLETEWYNGNVDEPAYERLNADLTGMVATLRREAAEQLSLPVSMAIDALPHAATRFEDEAGHRPERTPKQRG